MKTALKVIWPLALAQLVSAVNVIWDRYQLAMSGEAPLAASLSASMIAAMFVGTIAATVGYTSTFVAQLHGEGRGRDALRCFVHGVYLSILSIPILFLVLVAANLLVDFAGHAPDVAQAEKDYIAILIPAGIFTILNFVFSGFLAGQAKTRYVAVGNVTGIAVNIALNPVFIHGWGPIPPMATAGAALAAAAAAAATTALLFVGVIRNRLFRDEFDRDSARFDPKLLVHMLKKALPNGLNCFSGCIAFTTFVIVIGKLDALSAGASNTVFAVNNIFYCLLCAISEGTCILCGRRHGAGEDDRITLTIRHGLILAGFLLVGCFLTVLLFGREIVTAFYPSHASFSAGEFADVGVMLVIGVLFRDLMEAVLLVMEGALRGLGEMRFVFILKSICDLGLWMPSVLLMLHLQAPLLAFWLSMPVNFFLMNVLLVGRYRLGKWRTQKLFPTTSHP